MLRLPSAVLSVATVPALYSLGKRLFCSRVGIVAALLFAVHAVDIQYAQEARSYSLVIFLVTLSSLYFLRSIERPSLGNLVGYTLISVLSVYAHLFAALVLAAQWVFLFFLRPHEVAWRRLVASGIATSLLSAPAMFLALAASRYWAQGIHETSVEGVIDVFFALAGSLPRDSRITGKWLLLLYSITVVAAFIAFGRAWFRSERKTEASYGFLVSGLFIPVGLALAASFFRPLAEHIFSGLPARFHTACLGWYLSIAFTVGLVRSSGCLFGFRTAGGLCLSPLFSQTARLQGRCPVSFLMSGLATRL
jgi:uncharacterized membrane protein